MLSPVEAIVALWLAASPHLANLPAAVSAATSAGVRAPVTLSHDIPSSLLEATDEELLRRIETDPASLGSLSIGTPGSAILVNPVPLPPDARWEAARGAITWGTAETIAAIEVAVSTVHELFDGTPPLHIGDISDSDGGRLKRHASHQGGRDVDFGFYYQEGKGRWYAPGTAANLDLARNWALVRALVVRTDVETILLDMRIQRLLYKYALSIAEDKDWLDRVFQCGRGFRDALVRHLPLHRTHYHVRFYNQVAQEIGRRAHPMLVQVGVIEPPVFTIKHVVRQGQTLGHLASRYGVSVAAIKRANGLASTFLRAGRAYRIPMRAAVPVSDPVVVPPRPLPPATPPAMAAVSWPTVESLYGDRIAVWNEIAVAMPLAIRRF